MFKKLRCYWHWINWLRYYVQSCRESTTPWTPEEAMEILTDDGYTLFVEILETLVSQNFQR